MNAPSTLLVMALVVATLYFGHAMLLPLGIAVLLSFALAPLTVRLRRIGVPRIPSVIVVVLAVTLLLGGLATVVASQLLVLATDLPRYQYNMREKIRNVREMMPSGGALERATLILKDLGHEIDEAATANAPPDGQTLSPANGKAREPIPVEVHERPPTAIETLQRVLGPLVQPVVTAGMIIVFVIFMLIERRELRDRLIRLIDDDDLSRATKAMDDAARRVSRYLLMQLTVATLYGVPFGLGLYLIGVPSALLWGLLAVMLRFVPYIGPFIAAALPLMLAFAIDPGWSVVLSTLGLIFVLEMITSNVLEPWLYGSITGLSPVAILVAAVFWTTLWGPVGLLLSVPLTVCLVVLGRHVPQLAFLELLLGDRPALSDQERIYQRLLAGDRHEAIELAERFEDEHGFVALADELLIPALRLADRDRERRSLDQRTQERIAGLVEEIGASLVEFDPHAYDSEATAAARPRVFCVGGRHGLDIASASLLGRALEVAGIDVKVAAPTELRLAGAPTMGVRPEMVCVAYLTPPSPQHARRIARRVAVAVAPGVPVMVCNWWGLGDSGAQGFGDREAFAVTSVAQALSEVQARLDLLAKAGPQPIEATALQVEIVPARA